MSSTDQLHVGLETGGRGWIRTTVFCDAGFTVRCLQPLGHSSLIGALPQIRTGNPLVLSQMPLPIGLEGLYMAGKTGLEPVTGRLTAVCSTY